MFKRIFTYEDNAVDTAYKTNLLQEQFERFIRNGHYNDARKAVESMKTLGEKNKYAPAKVMAYINLSKIESYYGQYNLAIENVLIALAICQKLNNNILTALVYENIGLCYCQVDDYDRALEYTIKAVEIDPENVKVKENAGIICIKLKDLEKSLEYSKEALEYYTQLRQYNNMARVSLNIGEVYLLVEDFDNCRTYLDLGFSYGIKTNNNELKALSQFKIGELLYRKNELDEVEQYLLNAIELSQNVSRADFKGQIYALLVEFYISQSEFEKALTFKELIFEEKEKSINEENKKNLDNLSMKYKKEKKEHDTKRKQMQRVMHDMEIKFQHLQDVYSKVASIGEFGIFSNMMKNIVGIAERFHADRNIPILIEGETGTGKEIIARIIHHGTTGAISPFIVLNCSELSSSNSETELFGYEEGSFIGATKDGMIGKFEIAQGGTIYLDEVGELPEELQLKLLHLIQKKEIFRVGGESPIRLDVRIICSTNRDLMSDLKENKFRKDLFYRLNAGKIFIPPLCERKEEIGPLAQMFLRKFSSKKKKKFLSIAPKALDILENYKWPGNVRELENSIERVVLLHDDYELKPFHINFLELDNLSYSENHFDYIHIELPQDGLSMKKINQFIIDKVLNMFDGNKTKTAQFLSISRSSVYNKQ